MCDSHHKQLQRRSLGNLCVWHAALLLHNKSATFSLKSGIQVCFGGRYCPCQSDDCCLRQALEALRADDRYAPTAAPAAAPMPAPAPAPAHAYAPMPPAANVLSRQLGVAHALSPFSAVRPAAPTAVATAAGTAIPAPEDALMRQRMPVAMDVAVPAPAPAPARDVTMLAPAPAPVPMPVAPPPPAEELVIDSETEYALLELERDRTGLLEFDAWFSDPQRDGMGGESLVAVEVNPPPSPLPVRVRGCMAGTTTQRDSPNPMSLYRTQMSGYETDSTMDISVANDSSDVDM